MPDSAPNSITIVIPTFNRRSQLQKAVESVLQETRISLTVHIFDNASTDDTEAYATGAALADSRIRYTRNATNLGAVKNYILALASITSEYYVPLADDDWLLPDFLFDAFQILERHASAGAAIFVSEARDETGELKNTYPGALEKIRFGLLEPKDHLHDWMSHGHYAWSSVLWRTSNLKLIGYPYLHVGLPSDVDFQAQIFSRIRVFMVNRPGAVFLLHEQQGSRAFDLSHIYSWASLFKRLDRTISRIGLFETGVYLELRKIMQRRYHGIWNIPAGVAFSQKERVAMAAMAGFRLDDWRLAFALLDAADLNAPDDRLDASEKSPDGQIVLLPELAGGQNGDERDRDGRAGRGFLLSVMLWFKKSQQACALLDAKASALENDKRQLEAYVCNVEAEVRDGENREKSAAARADEWRTRSEWAEAELRALRNRRIVKVAMRLGLIR